MECERVASVDPNKVFKTNTLQLFKILKDKPDTYPARVFVSEAINALLEQEFDFEFEVSVPTNQAARTRMQFLDLANKLRALGINASCEVVDGLSEEESLIVCTVVIE